VPSSEFPFLDSWPRNASPGLDPRELLGERPLGEPGGEPAPGEQAPGVTVGVQDPAAQPDFVLDEAGAAFLGRRLRARSAT